MRFKDDHERPTLSIVVPVYNIENYITECIKSIFAQDYDDYELILVDDGSADKSGDICDTFVNDRTRVLHTNNRGLSEARNAGMDVSRGRYILFMDGDDVMIRGRLKKLMLAAVSGGAPVTVFDLDAFDDVSGDEIDLGYNYDAQRLRSGNKAEVMDELLRHECVPWSTACNIFMFDFLREKKLRFLPEAYGVEDCQFFLDVAHVCNKYEYTHQSLIRYRMHRKGSIMNTPDLAKLEARAKVYEEWIDYANELADYGGSGNGISARMGDAFFYNVLQMYHKNIEQGFYDIVKEHSGILSYCTGLKKRAFYRLVRTVGAKSAFGLTVHGKYKEDQI